MSWPDHCPGYLPPAVWEFAQELRDAPTEIQAERAALARLIAPDMARTWQSLAKRGIDDRTSWRLLLDLFTTSAPGAGFSSDLRAALVKVNGTPEKPDGTQDKPGLLGKIAPHAAALAGLVEELAELRDRHGLSLPLELTHTLSLLERAGYRDPPRPVGRLMSDAEEALAAVPLPVLLDTLAVAAATCKAAPDMPHEAHATTRKSGRTTEWVRSIDARFRLYYAAQIHPKEWTFTDTELARIGSAVLGLEVTRETVKVARERAPDDLQSDSMIFF